MTATVEDARACLRHYADEIREYIEDDSRAPDPALFRIGIERINSVTGRLFSPEDIREVIDLVIKNL